MKSKDALHDCFKETLITISYAQNIKNSWYIAAQKSAAAEVTKTAEKTTVPTTTQTTTTVYTGKTFYLKQCGIESF